MGQKAIVDAEYLDATADAIRAKLGTTNGIYLKDFPFRIGQIEGGGDASAYARSILDRTVTEFVDPVLTHVYPYTFAMSMALERVDIPNVEEIEDYAFYINYALTDFNAPKVKKIGSYAMCTATKLKSVNFPVCERIGDACFMACYDLERADFSVLERIGEKAFSYCYSLTALIIRSPTVCGLGTDALDGCIHFTGETEQDWNPDALKDGYIYVPRDLVEQYKVANNWSEWADQIRAIEDYPDICGG